MWWDAVIFIGFFGGMFIVRIIVATIVFFWILPEGDRCPLCDAHTLRVQSKGWNRITPWLRTSWCYECGWDGLLRPTPAPPRVPITTGTVPSEPVTRREVR